MTHRLLPVIAAAMLCFVSAGVAQAQVWPARPVRLIVTFTTGGAADITARMIGDKLTDLWKQQVIVENRIGAGGNIGVEAVYRAAPDGYTLLLASNTHAINVALYPKLPFDLTRDFAGLGLTTSTPMVIAVNPRVKENNLGQFTALLRSQPGKLSYATCGVATAHHFAMELYKYATRTFAVHIPHRGCTPAVVDAVAGQVDIVVASLAAVLPHARAGKLKVIALTTAERSPSSSEFPTMRESGLPELKDFGVENYYGFMSPAGVPREIRSKIEADLKTVTALPDLKQRLNAAGLDLFLSNGEQMIATLRADVERFRKAIEIAGIKPE
ncbi:MAG: tripartite tricarboxylate transporter substrate binding protein [Betaproteobacteria bacterium]|nr:tripartite tricarboxylate transporter substrate binding protein [Betaproteobacteria bacterium]